MSDKPPTYQPHPGLSKATRAWFCDVLAQWELEPHHARLLEVAAAAYDEHQKATRLIQRRGLTVKTPSGFERPNPALKIAAEARATFMRALRELDLDIEGPAEAKRPPMLRSVRSGGA